MSEQLLHLDRLGEVDEHTVFELSFTNAHPAGPTHKIEGHGIYNDVGQDDYDYMEQYFSGGLTGHGKNYLYNCIDLSKKALSNQEQFLEESTIVNLFYDQQVNDDWVREIVFELIRRDRHPERLSRFQSVFGVRTEKELQKWIELPSVNLDSGEVYKVASDNHIAVDASLLNPSHRFEQPIVWAQDLKNRAEQYWSQTNSKNPVSEILLRPPVEVEEHVKSIP